MPENRLFRVGEYLERYNEITGQSIPPGGIYQSPGLVRHIEKRHPENVSQIDLIPEILASPDYIGHNPKETDSVELVKVYGQNLMVCVKLDRRKGYLFVASFFSISQGKLKNRLNSGRLKRLEKKTEID
ncbi:MAG: hypothetical protein LUG44_04430 [Clostridiales bacterium]|nr:hypothetical protein [Clostridiales bacterium]